MATPEVINNLATEGAKNINLGLTLRDNQVNALLQLFEKGDYFAHINFGIESGRLMPHTLVKNIKLGAFRYHSIILLLGYLLRKGMDPNYYFDILGQGEKMHILYYISTNLPPGNSLEYIIDMFKEAGASLLLPGFKGTNNSRTVKDLLGSNYTDRNYDDDNYNLNGIFGIPLLPSPPRTPAPPPPRIQGPVLEINWRNFKSILLDKALIGNNDEGDILNFLEQVPLGERFIIRSVVMYLCVYCDAENCLRKSRDDELFLNSLGNMCQSTYMAINSQNLEIFKIIMDKGAECNYICMTELISRHNEASKNNDEILANVYGNMIEYAILTGSEIDEYQLKFLSLQASAELIENIKTNYEETEWNKSCNIIKNGSGSKFASQKLRQMAFNLNINYDLAPEKICEKLSVIANMDRVMFLKESIIRQEERIRRELIDNGDVSGEEPLLRTKCNAKSRLINNPYAYNDARMASYFDQYDGELYCFTSDLFEGLINTRKNPYNAKPLPRVFIETIKAQLNILKFLGLSKPRDNKKIGDSMKEIFDERKSIDNKIGEEIYYDGLVLYRLYTSRGEIDYRRKIDLDFRRVVKKFTEASFFYCVDMNYIIHSDFLKYPAKTNNDITGPPGPDSGVYNLERRSGNVLTMEYDAFFKYNYDTFKITKMFAGVKYKSSVPASGFNEILFRITSKHVSSLNDFYLNGKDLQNLKFYQDYNNNLENILNYFIR